MKITPLKMWVQNVLPVVYDDSLSYYEMVGKINEKTNEIITQVNENTDDIESLNYVIQELGDIDELKALLEEVETIVNDLYTSDTPEMDSANGSAGVADHAARSDHSHPSDSSKADASLGIDGASVGQYVKIKSVEAGVPTEFENGMPHEIPSGGTTGQVLRKESNGDYAADWGDVHEIPSGGSNGNLLMKNGATPYDSAWTNTPPQMGAIAHINSGNTADKIYNQNDLLVYEGKLYYAKVNIAQNVSLDASENGNIKEITIAEKIPKLTLYSFTAVSIPVGGSPTWISENISIPNGDYLVLASVIPDATNQQAALQCRIYTDVGTTAVNHYGMGNGNPAQAFTMAHTFFRIASYILNAENGCNCSAQVYLLKI